MNNPYLAPNATLSELASTGETYQPEFFSLHGRIGRVRYLAFSFLAMTLLSIVMGVLTGLLSMMLKKSDLMGAGVIGALLINIPVILVAVVMTKRRLHDLDRTGWAALFMLIPILNFFFGLYLMFASGSEGANRYGPKPVKNSVLLVIAGLLLPAVFVMGILAAVALPAYKSYTMRAKAASQSVNR